MQTSTLFLKSTEMTCAKLGYLQLTT